MTSLGSILHLGSPRTLSIFFPLAEFDLDDYLFGQKKSDSIQTDPGPVALIEEFAGLTHALNYLHNDIRLSHGGEHLICIHNDLKPDNVLVVAEPGAPVGRWKVTDFGLSAVKEARRSSATATLDDRISVRASLTSPKRPKGTFQASEIARIGEKVVGPMSDIWALGCILCLVLMYAVGGVQAVEDFQRRRCRQKKSLGSSKDYEHDYFYRDNDINPEVVQPLDEVAGAAVWAKNCVQIIKTILKIEPADRPKAKLIEDRLFARVLDELNKEGSVKSGTPIRSAHEGR